MTGGPPLPVLLAHVLLDVTRRFEQATERPSIVLWANLLRVVPDEGIAVGALPAAARTSRRTVPPWLALKHWVEVDGAKTVRPTEAGRQARDRWRDLLAATEQATPGAERLRAELLPLVARLELELPHYPVPYGPSDQRVLGGGAVPAREGPPRVPAHGTDWAPVVRTDPAAVADLPLSALLSQALLAFTIDYEDRTQFPMGVAAMLGEVMPTRSVPLDTVPRVLGVKGSGKTFLERHGIVRVGSDRVVTLTDTGLAVRNRHPSTVDQVTGLWRDRFGAQAVDDLTAALADADARLGHGLPDHVVVHYRAGAGFADVSSAVVRAP